MKMNRDMPFYTDVFLDNACGGGYIPPYLYHYTSIDTFALILRNQTIRFNRLDMVNDAEEALASDLPSANTTQFVSCWTVSDVESIPLWEMYTRMVGVRIRLPSNMFKGRPDPEIYDHGGALTLLNEGYHIKRVDSSGCDFFGWGGLSMFGPNPVYYSDDRKYLCPTVLFEYRSPDEAHLSYIGLNTIDLGCVKGTAWSFENEWRYKVSLFGIGQMLPNDTLGKMQLDLVTNPVSTKFIDIALDPCVLNEIEVTIAPNVEEKDLVRLTSLLKQYAPEAVTMNSVLKIRPSH